jgi:hypothetical protein
MGRGRLAESALSALLRGAALAILLSALMTIVNRRLPFVVMQELPPEVLARTHPSPINLVIALAGGLAAAYAMTRPKISAALPGVAITTALMPPTFTPTLTSSPTITPTFVPTATATLTSTSTSTPTPGLVQVVVTSVPAPRLYQGPQGPVIGQIHPGQVLTLLYGRQEAGGLVWVEVMDEEGRLGWIPLFYVNAVTATPSQ